MALAGARAGIGEFAEAREALLECLRIAPSDAVTLRVRLAAACAGIEQALGRHDEARRRLESTLHALPDRGSRDAAAVMVDLAVGASYRMEYERAREWGDRALAVVRPLGDRPLTAAAAAVCALSLALRGEPTEALPYLDEARELVDAMPDEEVAARLDGLAHLSAAEGYLDRFEEGVAHAYRGFGVARASGQGQLFPVLVPAINTSLCELGRLTEARELLEGAIEGARLAGTAQPLAWHLLSLAIVRMLAGDLDGARDAVDESVELCRGFDASIVSSYCGVMDGNIRIEAGEPEHGVAVLVASAGGLDLPNLAGGWRAWHLDYLTTGLLAAPAAAASGEGSTRSPSASSRSPA